MCLRTKPPEGPARIPSFTSPLLPPLAIFPSSSFGFLIPNRKNDLLAQAVATGLRRQGILLFLLDAGLGFQLRLHLAGMETSLEPVRVSLSFPCCALVAFTPRHPHPLHHHHHHSFCFHSTPKASDLPDPWIFFWWSFEVNSVGAPSSKRPDYRCITGPQQQYIK